MELAELKDIHPNEDIYILASGPSLGFIASSFFENKIVIAINHTIEYVQKCLKLYLIAKDLRECMQDSAKNKEAKIICTKYHGGVFAFGSNIIKYPDITAIFEPYKGAVYEKSQKQSLDFDYSTTISAMHLGAFMGAKNLILVGHDCGVLDGEIHAKDYNNYNAKYGVKTNEEYKIWMMNKATEKKTLDFKNKLKEVYGLNVYSINPFINFRLEGHTYSPFQMDIPPSHIETLREESSSKINFLRRQAYQKPVQNTQSNPEVVQRANDPRIQRIQNTREMYRKNDS